MSRIKTKFIVDQAVTTAKIADVNADVGTFTNATVTVNAKGQVTAAASGGGGGSAITSLTGDVTGTGPGAAATTLATVNSNVGTFAAATVTVNAKGLVTAASATQLTPTIFGSRGTPRSIVAATGITSGASHMSTTAPLQDIYVEGSITGNSVAATITAGTIDGQTMRIIGRNNTNTLSLTTATTNVTLNGDISLGLNNTLTLRWDTVEWVEVNRS